MEELAELKMINDFDEEFETDNWSEIDYQFAIQSIIENLVIDAEELGFNFSANDVYFDDSRAWSLYVYGETLDLDVCKFGAYREYLGGGVRGGLCSNGREQDNTLKLAELFENALTRIEDIYNHGYENAESWELPTGVLL